MYSLASMATMAACIFMFGIFFCLVQNINYIVKIAESGVAVTAFFDEDMSEAEIKEIGERIEARSEVSEMVFVSAEEAWEEYKEVYFSENPKLAEGFADDNPLVDSASYTIYLSKADALQRVSYQIENIDGVRKVNKSEITANSLVDASGLIGMVSITTIVVLFLVAWFLIGNTVSVGITVRSEEIAIMKLLGAKNGFVRAPFIVEGVIIGLIGAMLPMVAIYFLYDNVVSYIVNKFLFLSNILTFLPVKEIFTSLVPIAAILGVGIGFLGSYTTLRKHLKV